VYNKWVSHFLSQLKLNDWTKNLTNKLAFLVIFSIALNLRLLNVNWDQGTYLHPDERFLGMVTTELKLPASWEQYLDPTTSTLSPRNQQQNFYVYGNLPLTLNRLIAEWREATSLLDIILQGRILSALADVLIVLILYKTIQLFESKLKFSPEIKLWSSLIYALAVLPIQQAHFFTADTFLNLFSFASFYFSCRYLMKKNWRNIALASAAFGLALACKISAVYIFPLNLSIISIAQLNLKKFSLKQIVRAWLPILGFCLSVYLFFRFGSPYQFADKNWFNLQLSKKFIDNLIMLKSWEGGHVWYPPAIQWINRPNIIFSLKNLVFFGFGLVPSLFLFVGQVKLIKKFIAKIKQKKINQTHLAIILTNGWVACFFIYQACQFVKSIRYFLILYPFLAIGAAVGLTTVLKKINPKHFFLTITIVLFSLVIWPLMFISIYVQPHSRIQASHWLIKQTKTGQTILSEYWDDALPLALTAKQPRLKHIQLRVFDRDTDQKWLQLEQNLKTGDYYVLSSNRAWASIGRLPQKYPNMSQFYDDLFTDQTAYRLAAKFSSYPSLEYLGIPLTLPDYWAEEAFTVYDHPEVLIFKKNDN